MTKPNLENLRIFSLTAENVKRLVAVRIRPDGNVVQLTGKNGQGKTSVLDAIWWCLAGGRNIQTQPIRKGQQRAFITLDLGAIVVTRTFTRKGDADYTSQITVESQEGALFKSPQDLINGLLGSLSFDPLHFARMDAGEQYDTLRKFVPGIDFDLVDGQNQKDYDRRTVTNRMALEAAASASMIAVPEDTPEEEVDTAALLEQLRKAGLDNERAVEWENLRQQADAWGVSAREALAGVEQQIAEAIAESERIRDNAIMGYEAQIEQLRQAIEHSRTLCTQVCARESTRLRADAAGLQQQLTDNEAKLAEMGQPPAIIDTAALYIQIAKAGETNKQVGRAAERARHRKTAEQYQRESDELTANIKARTAAKEAAIAAAALPVPGLSFGNRVVLLKGVPFKQASDAEQLTTSVAIAMKSNPALRVIRIRDGSLLDEEAMKLLDRMAAEHDFQVWIERVDGSGTVGFVLEDGHVRKAQVAEEATA